MDSQSPAIFNGDSILHVAVRQGWIEDVRDILFQQHLDVNILNYKHETPLHLACSQSASAIVQLLIAFGADPYIRDSNDKTAYGRSSFNIDTLMNKLLCRHGLWINGPAQTDNDSPIHTAVRLGILDDVQSMIEEQIVDINDINASHETPLHLACALGHKHIVHILISNGADMYKRDCYNNAPIYRAVSQGHVDILDCLIIDYACDPKIKGYQDRTLLHFACGIGNVNLVNILIHKYGISPMATDAINQTPLHIAASHGQEEVLSLLITKYNSPVDCRSNYKFSPLHLACYGGHVSVVKTLVLEYKADLNALDKDRDTPFLKAALGGSIILVQMMIANFNQDINTKDYQNSTPLCKAALGGCTNIVQMLINEFGCSPLVKGFEGRSLIHYACNGGMTVLAMTLITDFNLDPLSVDDRGNTPLHIACWSGHKELARLLITKYNCPVDVKNNINETPLHKACSCGHPSVVRVLVSEFKANLMALDHENNTPVNKAALGGHASIIQMLITEFGYDPQLKGFEGRSLLHQACSKGNVLTAKMLIKEFPSLIHFTDNYGDSPLHLSSLYEQVESVRLLLFEYHAPVFVRDKAGKTALDLTWNVSIKKIFKEYMSSEHKGIQREYEKLQTLSSQKYSGHQIITRVFVLGHPGSGKSTLVESLKRKGVISSFFLVPENDVPPHTAGIVPSFYQSKEAGRLLYYDFAGDGEYYSSHAAILEMVSHSTIGTNVYLIVANLRKDGMTLCNEIGYWLSFISYHMKVMDNQHRLKVVVVLSHSDCLSLADSTNKLDGIKQYLQNQKDHCNIQKMDIVNVLSSNCRRPRSAQVIEDTLQQISVGTPPYSISFETSLLHGMLQKDFGNVVACKFQDLLNHIEDTCICPPVVADTLYPLVKELHDIGVLMMIGRSEDKFEDYLLLLNLSSLTNEVHEMLFSESAIQKLNFSVNPHYSNMGILPERYLTRILPKYITKECLIQLQYCQEFNHAEVGLNYLVTPDDTLNDHLLYFPALCKLESEQSSWPTDPKLTFSIGWYTKCIGKFDYFPARYLHVLLLRLAFAFALPIADCNIIESNEVTAHNRRCTLWKNGIRWLMEEGVECIFEIINDNKGIVVITKSEEHSEEWVNILGQIIAKVMQAKEEFCRTVSLQHFLLNSDCSSSFKDHSKLFAISDVERVIREEKKKVVSVSGHTFLDLSPTLNEFINQWTNPGNFHVWLSNMRI